MANIIKIKRGAGYPGSGLQAYELGWDTSTNSLYIGNGVDSTLIVNSFTDDVSIDPLTGNVTITNNLNVNGDTTLGNSNNDSTTLRGTVTISDSTKVTNIKGTLNVDEAVTLDTTLGVTGLSSLDGGINVNSSAFTVGTTGNIVTTGDLTVNGVSVLGDADTDSLTARGTVTLSDSTKVTNIKGTLNVDEAATFDATVGVTGDTTLGSANTNTNIIRGTVTLSDSTKVTNIKGTLNVDEAVTLDTTLGVTGNSTLGTGTTNINTVYGTVNLSNPSIYTTVKGLLNVDEEATFDSTVGVTGATTLHSTLDVVGDVEIGTLGIPTVTIEATTGDISTSGNVTIGGDLVVQGTTTTVESTVVTISDPVFTLGSSTVQDFKDRGIEYKFNDGTSGKVGFFGWNEAIDMFTFIPDASNTTEIFTGAYGDFAVGEIYQPQTNEAYDVNGSLVNVSEKWNATYNVFKDGVRNAAQYEILQFDGTEFIATTSPAELTIDCGSY